MSSCHDVPDLNNEKTLKKQDKILLMGNPNVGKSVFFTKLTGVHAISSNFTGTTVSFMEGRLKTGNSDFTLIDVPGTYSLSPTSEAEAVAVRFVESGAKAILCVLDASNLERNLHLALELRKLNIPIVYALNLLDLAERHGISVDAKLLEQELAAPVIPTVAVKNKGVAELKNQLTAVLNGEKIIQQKDIQNEAWAFAKEICNRVSRKNDSSLKSLNFLDRLGDSMMKPFPGIPIAIFVMLLLIGVVVGGGRALRALLLLPLVNNVIVPFFRGIFSSFVPEGVFLNILVGEYGIFVISFEWIIALILPYVFFFYIGFSFLEDSGYMPRISVLFDNVMRKVGIQGGSLIYTIMGFGCAVPAIIGTRTASSRKERIVVSTAICFAIPCISQTGALITLMSSFSIWMLPVMIIFGISVFLITALISGKLVKGKVDPLLLEVPNLLMPEPRAYAKKLMTRMKHFLMEAEVPMMIAIVIASLLKETGLLDIIAIHAQPLVSAWLGLPKEAVVGLILGIVRREMSVAPLLALNLTALQAFVAGVVSLMYLPCLSVFGILTKEFKLKAAVTISGLSIIKALLIGGLINQIAQIFIRG